MLNMTPRAHMVDTSGRPYFLWDVDMDLDQFRQLLEDPDPEVRAYTMGKLMRQARPDDVFQFVTLKQIRSHFSGLERYLGDRLDFWRWLLDCWEGGSGDQG